MLIVCPSCATSYMIDTASLGAGGRMVRCARCKATWFAGGPQEEEQQQVSVFVDEVIAEAEAESTEPEPFLRAPAGEPTPPPTIADDFVGSDSYAASPPEQAAESPPMFEAPALAEDAAGEPAPTADYEPETIAEAPSLVPPMDEAPATEAEPEPESHDTDDVETYAARRRRLKSRRKQAKRSSRWTAAVLVLLAVNVAIVGGRSEVVYYLPQTASLFAAIGLPVNLRQLKFENVRISPSGADGQGLTVEGTIVSAASKSIKVPTLRFAARNAAGQEIYTWTKQPMRNTLDPGDKLSFRSELASPPADAKDVLVRFLTAKEAAAMAAHKPAAMAKPADGNSNH